MSMSYFDNGFNQSIEKMLDPKFNPDEFPETYDWSPQGFRCDDFNLPTDASVVFLGCSITLGVGVEREQTWAYQLWRKITEATGKKIPYWNISSGGIGIGTLARLLYHWEDKLQPRVVIALFPTYRLEQIVDGMGWDNIMPGHDTQNILETNPWITQQNVMRYETHRNLAIIDLILQKNRTLLVWDSWDPYFHRGGMSANNRLKCFDNDARAWNYVPRTDIGLDGVHPGPLSHAIYADHIWTNYGVKIISAVDGAL